MKQCLVNESKRYSDGGQTGWPARLQKFWCLMILKKMKRGNVNLEFHFNDPLDFDSPKTDPNSSSSKALKDCGVLKGAKRRDETNNIHRNRELFHGMSQEDKGDN